MQWLGWLLLGAFLLMLVTLTSYVMGFWRAMAVWAISMGLTALALVSACLIVTGRWPWEVQGW